MKRGGIIVFVAGLIITLVTGLSYMTSEVIVESGELSLNRDVRHGFSWSPFIGVGLMVIGGMIFISGFRKQKVLANDHKPYFKR